MKRFTSRSDTDPGTENARSTALSAGSSFGAAKLAGRSGKRSRSVFVSSCLPRRRRAVGAGELGSGVVPAAPAPAAPVAPAIPGVAVPVGVVPAVPAFPVGDPTPGVFPPLTVPVHPVPTPRTNARDHARGDMGK